MKNEVITAPNDGLIRDIVRNIDFQAVYERILDTVANNPRLVYTPEFNEKVERYNSTIDTQPRDFFKFLIKDEEGKIQIRSCNYSMDKDAFTLINFVVHETICKIIKEEFAILKEYHDSQNLPKAERKEDFHSFRDSFYQNLRKVYAANSKVRGNDNLIIKGLVNYFSKEDYVKSCARVSILNDCLLFLKGSNVYLDTPKNTIPDV